LSPPGRRDQSGVCCEVVLCDQGDDKLWLIKTGQPNRGAIGFDWMAAGVGGVPWLISWPRKKLIKRHLPKSMSPWLPN
jgi:hypothetical protein